MYTNISDSQRNRNPYESVAESITLHHICTEQKTILALFHAL